MAKRELSKCRVWERERRDRLKNSFNALGKLLPCYDPSSTLSKIEILQKAAALITELQNKNKELLLGGSEASQNQREEIQKLEERIKKLLIRNEQLTNLLQTAGIKLPTVVGTVQNFNQNKKFSYKITPEIAENLCKKLNKNNGSSKKVSTKNKNPKAIKNGQNIHKKKKKIIAPNENIDLNNKQKLQENRKTSSNKKKSLKNTSTTTSPEKQILAPQGATLGPGALIFADGRVLPIARPLQAPPRPLIPPIITQNPIQPKLITNTTIPRPQLLGSTLTTPSLVATTFTTPSLTRPLLATPTTVATPTQPRPTTVILMRQRPVACKTKVPIPPLRKKISETPNLIKNNDKRIKKKKLVTKKKLLKKVGKESIIKNNTKKTDFIKSSNSEPLAPSSIAKLQETVKKIDINNPNITNENSKKELSNKTEINSPKTDKNDTKPKEETQKNINSSLPNPNLENEKTNKKIEVHIIENLDPKNDTTTSKIDKISHKNTTNEPQTNVNLTQKSMAPKPTKNISNKENSSHTNKGNPQKVTEHSTDIKSTENLPKIEKNPLSQNSTTNLLVSTDKFDVGPSNLNLVEPNKIAQNVQQCIEENATQSVEKLERNDTKNIENDTKSVLNEKNSKTDYQFLDNQKNLIASTQNFSMSPTKSVLTDFDNVPMSKTDTEVANHSELSNDIFATFSSGNQPSGHPESLSPTAAFLLAFPLVSTLTGSTTVAAKTGNDVTNDDNSDSRQDTPTLLQIGTIESTTPKSASENLINLDNFTFFGHGFDEKRNDKRDKNQLDVIWNYHKKLEPLKTQFNTFNPFSDVQEKMGYQNCGYDSFQLESCTKDIQSKNLELPLEKSSVLQLEPCIKPVQMQNLDKSFENQDNYSKNHSDGSAQKNISKTTHFEEKVNQSGNSLNQVEKYSKNQHETSLFGEKSDNKKDTSKFEEKRVQTCSTSDKTSKIGNIQGGDTGKTSLEQGNHSGSNQKCREKLFSGEKTEEISENLVQKSVDNSCNEKRVCEKLDNLSEKPLNNFQFDKNVPKTTFHDDKRQQSDEVFNQPKNVSKLEEKRVETIENLDKKVSNRGPVNWMTTPDTRHQIGENLPPLELGTIFGSHNWDYKTNEEENRWSWSPGKLLPPLIGSQDHGTFPIGTSELPPLPSLSDIAPNTYGNIVPTLDFQTKTMDNNSKIDQSSSVPKYVEFSAPKLTENQSKVVEKSKNTVEKTMEQPKSFHLEQNSTPKSHCNKMFNENFQLGTVPKNTVTNSLEFPVVPRSMENKHYQVDVPTSSIFCSSVSKTVAQQIITNKPENSKTRLEHTPKQLDQNISKQVSTSSSLEYGTVPKSIGSTMYYMGFPNPKIENSPKNLPNINAFEYPSVPRSMESKMYQDIQNPYLDHQTGSFRYPVTTKTLENTCTRVSKPYQSISKTNENYSSKNSITYPNTSSINISNQSKSVSKEQTPKRACHIDYNASKVDSSKNTSQNQNQRKNIKTDSGRKLETNTGYLDAEVPKSIESNTKFAPFSLELSKVEMKESSTKNTKLESEIFHLEPNVPEIQPYKVENKTVESHFYHSTSIANVATPNIFGSSTTKAMVQSTSTNATSKVLGNQFYQAPSFGNVPTSSIFDTSKTMVKPTTSNSQPSKLVETQFYQATSIGNIPTSNIFSSSSSKVVEQSNTSKIQTPKTLDNQLYQSTSIANVSTTNIFGSSASNLMEQQNISKLHPQKSMDGQFYHGTSIGNVEPSNIFGSTNSKTAELPSISKIQAPKSLENQFYQSSAMANVSAPNVFRVSTSKGLDQRENQHNQKMQSCSKVDVKCTYTMSNVGIGQSKTHSSTYSIGSISTSKNTDPRNALFGQNDQVNISMSHMTVPVALPTGKIKETSNLPLGHVDHASFPVVLPPMGEQRRNLENMPISSSLATGYENVPKTISNQMTCGPQTKNNIPQMNFAPKIDNSIQKMYGNQSVAMEQSNIGPKPSNLYQNQEIIGSSFVPKLDQSKNYQTRIEHGDTTQVQKNYQNQNLPKPNYGPKLENVSSKNFTNQKTPNFIQKEPNMFLQLDQSNYEINKGSNFVPKLENSAPKNYPVNFDPNKNTSTYSQSGNNAQKVYNHNLDQFAVKTDMVHSGFLQNKSNNFTQKDSASKGYVPMDHTSSNFVPKVDNSKGYHMDQPAFDQNKTYPSHDVNKTPISAPKTYVSMDPTNYDTNKSSNFGSKCENSVPKVYQSFNQNKTPSNFLQKEDNFTSNTTPKTYTPMEHGSTNFVPKVESSTPKGYQLDQMSFNQNKTSNFLPKEEFTPNSASKTYHPLEHGTSNFAPKGDSIPKYQLEPPNFDQKTPNYNQKVENINKPYQMWESGQMTFPENSKGYSLGYQDFPGSKNSDYSYGKHFPIFTNSDMNTQTSISTNLANPFGNPSSSTGNLPFRHSEGRNLPENLPISSSLTSIDHGNLYPIGNIGVPTTLTIGEHGLGVPTTLPTLVGELGLGSGTNLEQDNRRNTSRENSRRKNVQNIGQNYDSNTFSVSHLVEPNQKEENRPQGTKRNHSTGKSSVSNRQNKRKNNDCYRNQNQKWSESKRLKNTNSTNYSAEALISDSKYQQYSSGNNQQFSSTANFHSDNQGSVNQQTLYLQQQEVYPTFGTSYSGTFYGEDYPNTEKETRKSGQCQAKKHTSRSSKARHHTPEIMTPYVDLSFLSMPGAISSPLLSEGAEFNAPTNVPPLYYGRPYGPNSPTTNNVSGQLTSFNLSAIFPEIGSGKAAYNSSGKNSTQPSSSNSTFIPTTFSNS